VQCSFETRVTQPALSKELVGKETTLNSDNICELRVEIGQLRELLSEVRSQQRLGNDGSTETFPATTRATSAQVPLHNELFDNNASPAASEIVHVSDPRGRRPSGFYRQHTLMQFFCEVRLRTAQYSILCQSSSLKVLDPTTLSIGERNN
jgi:hypothetical protein